MDLTNKQCISMVRSCLNEAERSLVELRKTQSDGSRPVFAKRTLVFWLEEWLTELENR